MPRYDFDEFVLSPRRRRLLRGGNEQPLIPRYFDLLVFLVEHRHEAVHRQDIFDRVWKDVTVSDSALSQAIRTIRLALGDDPREPRFIRTVSRHGYQFVCPDVREVDDAAVDTDDAAVAANWIDAALGGGLAGAGAGALGGLILAIVPGTTASFAMAPVLALIGASSGAAGAAGVGAGMLEAEARTGLHRIAALFAGGAAGGAIVGTAAQFLARWSLAALVGLHVDVGGGLEGLLIGAAAGLGFAIASSGADAARRRARVAIVTAAFCGLAALALTVAGHPLVGGTIHLIATATSGSEAALTPLGRLIGEPDFGPVSRAIIATGEAVVFGLGLALGLTRRR
ncbi:MAG: hypothetical protein EPO35_09610 [Acidobacteria bacterium]|nr:MAG: hypothetical protein EPO35_09610 [Acidobacteriota bacterium]